MTTPEQLTQDMKDSMKAGDSERTGVLRLLKSALKYEEIKLGHPLSEAEVLKVLQREAKQRKDSIEAYKAAGRQDLLDVEEQELGVIATYLPKAMSESELTKIVDAVISELGATGMPQLGQVIGEVMKRVGAQADGGAVAQLVRARLSA